MLLDIGESRSTFSVLMSIGCLFVISSQLNYFYGYKLGIEPTFVRVFHSMSGKVMNKVVPVSECPANGSSGIPGNTGSTELRRKFCPTSAIPKNVGLYRQSDIKRVLQYKRIFRIILVAQ